MKKSLIALSIAASFATSVNAIEQVSQNQYGSGSPVEMLQKVKNAMGNVARGDMQGYKALLMMAESREDKIAVVKMMIVNETSTDNILTVLANNEDFVTEYPEFFDGVDRQGNPIPTKDLSDIVNGKRSIKWDEQVKSFYNNLESKINGLEGDDLQKSINLLDSISIQGKKSLLDTLQANGHLENAPLPTEKYSKDLIEDKIRNGGDVIIAPIDVVITPIEPVSTEKKVETVNKLFSAAGLDSTIDGTTITFVSPSTGITTSYDLATLTTEQLVKLKAEAKSVFKQGIDDRRVNAPIVDPIDPGFGVDPIDVVIEPIDPGFGVDPIDVVIEPIDPGFGVDPIDVVIEPIDPGFGIDPIDVVIEPIDPGFDVDPIDVVIEPIDPGFGVDPIDVVIEPIDPGFDVEPIAPTPETAKEFKEVVDASIGEGTVDAYLAADAADKEVLAQDILASDGAESLKNIMIPNPAYSAASDAPKQISLHDYLSDVADPDITPPGFEVESGELVLKNAGANLQIAGDNLYLYGQKLVTQLTKHEQAQTDYMKESNAALGNDIQSNQIAIVALQDNDTVQNERMDTGEDALVAALNDINASSAENAQHIEGLNEAMTKTQNHIVAGEEVLTSAGQDMKTVLTAEISDLQAQIDRLNSGDDGTNPPTVDEELRAGLVVAKEKVETELVAVNKSVDIVANSAANNSTLIATNSANQAATNDALQSAGQELQAKAGKAVETLETARSGMNAGANELMAALQAMQAQMDAQARLIAELQAGENPGTGLPTGIDEEVRDGLQTASDTMQKKLGTAADTLKTASKGLKNNKPQNGVQPIQPTDPVEPVTPLDPREHEYGSVGNGAATAWLNERIDSGKGLMNEHLDAEFTAFEDKITAMYQSDMASFQEDVQDEMDGVMASTHAITNSRPFLSNGGTAVGVGIGAAGDASAVAIGVAHSFKDTGWSVSGSVNATTGSSSDVSLGAGVQFQF